MDQPTFIVTARLDAESAAFLTSLRARYFPPDRNFLDAHVTLFHKLTASGLDVLDRAVVEADPRPIGARLASPYSLGRGVAIRVESGGLVALRGRLADRLHADLSAQDRQRYAPHATIQNKVTAGEAGRCLAEVREGWSARAARFEGIDLWEYLGGPWKHQALLPFRDGSPGVGQSS